MKKISKNHRCNHCGGLMRRYMDGTPTCVNCGRYYAHKCSECNNTPLLIKLQQQTTHPRKLAA